MYDFLLETAVGLVDRNHEIDIDEVAAVAGVTADQVRDYFPSVDALRAAVARDREISA